MTLALRGVQRPPVLRGIDLQVRAGEAVGLLGANGSGKSTLLMVAAGVRRCTAGQVEAHGSIGWLGEPGPVPRTTAELLALTAFTHGLGADAVATVRGRLPLCDGPVEALSAGQRRLVLLAAAVLAQPSALLLDEPLTHLDAAGGELVVAELQRARERGAAVLVATHRPGELPLDRTMRLEHGRLA